MFRTALRNKRLYLAASYTDFSKPLLITSFWPCEAPAYEELDDLPVHELGEGKYIHAFNKDIPVNPTAEYAEFTEITPLKPPSRAYIWHNGEWVRKNRR